MSKYKKQLEKLKADYDKLKARVDEQQSLLEEHREKWGSERLDLEKRLADKDKAAEKIATLVSGPSNRMN